MKSSFTAVEDSEMRAPGESRRGGPKTPACCVLECFDGLIILKAEIHLAIAIGIAIAIDPSWDGRLIPIPIAIPREYVELRNNDAYPAIIGQNHWGNGSNRAFIITELIMDTI